MKWLINKPEWRYDGKSFSVESPLSFHQSLSVYEPVPLHNLTGLAKKLSLRQILVKDESHRFGLKAFKGLGASYAISRIVREKDVEGIVTATDGNHGRAVAWAARKFGLSAKIFMPKGSAEARVDAIKKEGAEVSVSKFGYDKTVELAQHEARKLGWTLVQDTSWDGYTEIPHLIMEGYLTQLVEVYEQLRSRQINWPDFVILQSGVGSWAAAVIWFLKEYLEVSSKIILVEPMESAGALESMQQNNRTVPKGNSETMMAGLNCGIPSLLAWPILKNGVDLFVAIEDDWTKKAMRQFYAPVGSDPQVISGESGAAGLAGLMAVLNNETCIQAAGIGHDSSMLLFSTEGDTDPEGYEKIISGKGIRETGNKKGPQN